MIQCITLGERDFELSDLSGFGILLDRGSGAVIHLNETGVAFLAALARAPGKDGAARSLSKHYDIPPERISRDLDVLLGDIEQKIDAVCAAKHEGTDSSALAGWCDLPDGAFPRHETYTLFEDLVSIAYPDPALWSALHFNLEPFLAPAPGTKRPDLVYDITRASEAYEIRRNGEPLIDTTSAMEARWAVARSVLAPERTPPPTFPLVLHGSAVVGRAGALVLSGVSGAGKSTLAAYLAANGCKVLSDDLLPFSVEQERVFPVPFALSIKAGARDTVSVFCKEIERAPTRFGPSGKKVSYIRPPTALTHRDRTGHRVAAFIFPTFGTDTDARIDAISAEQAFIRSLGPFGAFPRQSGALVALAATIAGTPTYEMSYSDCAGAFRLLEAFL